MSRLKKKMRPMVAVLAIAQLVVLPAPPVLANGGDFSLDFVAAAPFTYDHSTGGGAYDDRTIGKNKDVVESLEGGDFACGQLVTHFVQIRVAAGAAIQTIRLTFKWTADSTGQSGAAYNIMHNPKINTGVIAGGQGEGPGGTDAGNVEVAPAASVAPFSTDYSQVLFSKGAEHFATLDVSGLNNGDKVVLRFELDIACQPGSTPTGNLQAILLSAQVIAGGTGAISSGAQTIPLKKVDQIAECTPETCPPPCNPDFCPCNPDVCVPPPCVGEGCPRVF